MGYSVCKCLVALFSVVCISMQGYGQLSVGIVPGSLTVLPSHTITNLSTFSVQGTVVNTGSVPITGTVTLNMAINVGSAVTPSYVFRSSTSYVLNSFSPAASQLFSVNDVASSSNQYVITSVSPGAGNGTTVVVWPVLTLSNGNVIEMTDSVYDEVFVVLPANVEDLVMEKELIRVKNPVSHHIDLNYNTTLYTVELLNATGQSVRTICGRMVDVSGLETGIYYLSFYNVKSGKCITRKILIEPTD